MLQQGNQSKPTASPCYGQVITDRGGKTRRPPRLYIGMEAFSYLQQAFSTQLRRRASKAAQTRRAFQGCLLAQLLRSTELSQCYPARAAPVPPFAHLSW